MQIIETIPKLKARAGDAHKGDFGRVCIIAGSYGMGGAAVLAGRAAATVGSSAVLGIMLRITYLLPAITGEADSGKYQPNNV